MSRYATIVGTGRYVPQRVITNADLEAMLGEPVAEWLVENVGIEERHVMAEDETTSDLAVAASRQALARAGITADRLDLIIVATDTPDYISPATASVVQAKLGARNAGTYDVNCACAAWVTGLDIAAKTIATDPDYTYVLVVGAYGMTRFVDWTDKYTCTLFADGAGAVVLRADDAPGFLAAQLWADGGYHDSLGIYTGGTFRPATPEVITRLGKPRVEFVRKFPATFNTERWPPLVRKVVAKAGLTLDEVEKFFFTQLNLRTIEATMAALGQPISKTHWIMHKWGYTGSACIPMALDDAVEQGQLCPGDHVVFCASGGGIAMAAAVFRWTL
ncbi:MAG: ketoacyl-ACP synthase III [Chloroflexi bacterium]|nr:MAG: ketoacyl-ACP synthase III [Chloroflexota bacterium]